MASSLKSQTSLATQLKKLETPQTSQFKPKKGHASFLYSYLEAAGVSCDTHYSLALNGLEELIKIDGGKAGLERFRKSLFSETSKSFERGVQSKEDNERLDREIESFLWKVVAPYFQLTATHRVLEYLIYKYHISEFNTDTVILASLAYHETNLFAKLLQTIPEWKSPSGKWAFLHDCQRKGVHAPKSLLINRCISEPWLLDEISESVIRVSKETEMSSIYTTFATSIFLGVLVQECQREDILIPLLHFVESGLSCRYYHFTLAAYSVCAFMCVKASFDEEVLTKLIAKGCSRLKKSQHRDKLTENFVTLLMVLIDTQDISTIPKEAMDLILSSNGRSVALQKKDSFVKIMYSLASSQEDHENSLSLLAELASKHSEVICCEDFADGLARRLKILSIRECSEEVQEQVVHLLLSLAPYSRGKKIKKKLDKLLTSGTVIADVIDNFTVVEDEETGTRKRMPFDIKNPSWKNVVILLELVSQRKNLSDPNPIAEICLQLLKESVVLEEGESDSEYFRLLLLKCLSMAVTREGIDWKKLETQPIIEILRLLKKREGIQQCLKLLRIFLSHSKNKEDVLKNLMLIFAFSGRSQIKHEDDHSLSLLLEIQGNLTPSLVKSCGFENLLDVVLDSMADIVRHRRVPLIGRLLKSITPFQDWLLFTILSIVVRSVSHFDMNTSTSETCDSSCDDFWTTFAADIILSSHVDFPTKLIIVNELLNMLEELVILKTKVREEKSSEKTTITQESSSAPPDALSTIRQQLLTTRDESIRRLYCVTITSLLTRVTRDKERFVSKVISCTVASHQIPTIDTTRNVIDSDDKSSNNPSSRSRQKQRHRLQQQQAHFLSQVMSIIETLKEIDNQQLEGDQEKVDNKLIIFIVELMESASLSAPVTLILEISASLVDLTTNMSLKERLTSPCLKLALSLVQGNRDRLLSTTSTPDLDVVIIQKLLNPFITITVESLSSPSKGQQQIHPTLDLTMDTPDTRNLARKLVSLLSTIKTLIKFFGNIDNTEYDSKIDNNDEKKDIALPLFCRLESCLRFLVSTSSGCPSIVAEKLQYLLHPPAILCLGQVVKSLPHKYMSSQEEMVCRLTLAFLNTLESEIPLVRLAGMSSLNSFVSSFGDLLISPSPRDIIAEVQQAQSTGLKGSDEDMFSEAKTSILSTLQRCLEQRMITTVTSKSMTSSKQKESEESKGRMLPPSTRSTTRRK